ncbi:hypothetical protein PAXINDRAFT_50260, partial [Paxillus involutus ATCC 200175]
YNGPFDAIKKIYSQHGISGLFKGKCVTFLCKATGCGSYFLVYENFIREMTQKGIRRDQINHMNAILYAVIIRCSCWIWVDMIESRMQTDGFSPSTVQKY